MSTLDSRENDSRETERVSKTVIGIRKLKQPLPAPATTRVFVVANQKGGVGKTKGAQVKMSGSKPLGMKMGGKAC